VGRIIGCARESNIRIGNARNRYAVHREVGAHFAGSLHAPGMNAKFSGYAYGNRERWRNNSVLRLHRVDPPAVYADVIRRSRRRCAGKKSICILRTVCRKEIALTVVDRA